MWCSHVSHLCLWRVFHKPHEFASKRVIMIYIGHVLLLFDYSGNGILCMCTTFNWFPSHRTIYEFNEFNEFYEFNSDVPLEHNLKDITITVSIFPRDLDENVPTVHFKFHQYSLYNIGPIVLLSWWFWIAWFYIGRTFKLSLSDRCFTATQVPPNIILPILLYTACETSGKLI